MQITLVQGPNDAVHQHIFIKLFVLIRLGTALYLCGLVCFITVGVRRYSELIICPACFVLCSVAARLVFNGQSMG